MSLVRIVRDSDIDDLKKGDGVQFKHDEESYPWKDEAVFYGRDLEEMGFVSRAKEGIVIYGLSFCRSDLVPAGRGRLMLKPYQNISYTEITPEDPEYELYAGYLNKIQTQDKL